MCDTVYRDLYHSSFPLYQSAAAYFARLIQVWKEVLWPSRIPKALHSTMAPSKPLSAQSRALMLSPVPNKSAWLYFPSKLLCAGASATRKLKALAALWQRIAILRSRFGSREAKNCDSRHSNETKPVGFQSNWFHLVELLLETDGRCVAPCLRASCLSRKYLQCCPLKSRRIYL